MKKFCVRCECRTCDHQNLLSFPFRGPIEWIAGVFIPITWIFLRGSEGAKLTDFSTIHLMKNASLLVAMLPISLSMSAVQKRD